MKGRGTNSAARTPASTVLWVLPALLLAVSALLSARILEDRSGSGRVLRAHAPAESLLLEISRNPAFAFGFRSFLGDLAWLSAVQVAGARRMASGEYDRLYVLLQATTNFDPRFVVPYIFGGMVLGDSPAHVREALDILGRGAKNHPADWRFPFYVGYARYFSLGDPLGGAQALKAAARLPDSPPYLPLLASRMFAEGRAPETALSFLQGMIREETDPKRLEILERRIREVVVERDIQALEKAVAAYRMDAGSVPASLEELVRAGLIPRIPEEPNGGRYVLSPDGSVASTRVSTRLKVFRK